MLAQLQRKANGELIRGRAVVMGSGMAGLMAAGALARHFHDVVILERDQEAIGHAVRRGVPQGHHVHLLLAGGLGILTTLFPNLADDLQAAGAVQIRSTDVLVSDGQNLYPRRDVGIDYFGQTRPMLEQCVRNCVRLLPNVVIEYGCGVRNLTLTPDFRRVTGVQFVQNNSRRTVEARLVVDASGRNSSTPKWLVQAGFRAPEVTQIGIELGYSTALFAIPRQPRLDALAIAVGPCPPIFKRSGYLQTVEDGRWIVSLTGRHGDYPPGDPDSFLEFARSLRLPFIYEAIRGLVPLGPIRRYRTSTSIWRQYGQLTSFPLGLLPVGDAIASINPTYGQGVSCAAGQVAALDALFSRPLSPGEMFNTLAPRFFEMADRVIDSPWSQAAEVDLAFPECRGERPRKFHKQRQYVQTLKRLAVNDPTCQAKLFRVVHLMDSPSQLWEAEIARCVMQHLDETRVPPPRPDYASGSRRIADRS